MPAAQTDARPDYGLDAPGVVRNLALAAAVGFLPAALAALGIWDGVLRIAAGGVDVAIDLVPSGLAIGVTCAGMAAYIVWTSKWGKLRERQALLDLVPWRGDERVLDVGCGRGLLLVGAAHRVPAGTAVGIDLWQAEDLAGNRPDAPLENARREGVADRVRVETGDMRAMPFDDESFDVVVSRAAVHNIYDAPGRAQAIAEIARVLKPGGRLVLDDIRHLEEYAAALRAHGVADVRRVGSVLGSAIWTVLTFGSLRPGVLVGRKGKEASPSGARATDSGAAAHQADD
jgi:SAM-dependent methyltransferase